MILTEFVANDGGRPIMRKTKEVSLRPKEEKMIHAVSVIPADNFLLNYCTWRDEGHRSFRCLLIRVSQRLYFSHRNYLHHIESNPKISPYLEVWLQTSLHRGSDSMRLPEHPTPWCRNDFPGHRNPTRRGCKVQGRSRFGFSLLPVDLDDSLDTSPVPTRSGYLGVLRVGDFL